MLTMCLGTSSPKSIIVTAMNGPAACWGYLLPDLLQLCGRLPDALQADLQLPRPCLSCSTSLSSGACSWCTPTYDIAADNMSWKSTFHWLNPSLREYAL